MNLLQEIAHYLIIGKHKEVEALTQKALEEGMDVMVVLNEGLIAGMSVVGDKFRRGEYFVPEVLLSARAMKAGMAILRPLLTETGAKPIGKVVLGTVRGDLHDIGKNLVGMMMEGAGFQVIDLGVQVKPEKFVQAVIEHQPQIVGMSALLTTTMPAMADTIKAFREAGIRDRVVVMIGGAPVTQEYADEIGADGYAPDAASAVEKAKELLSV